MSVELHQSTTEAHLDDVVDGMLIESIWHELDRQLPYARVRCVVTEVALGFQDATVKTFLPILVHRKALERLRQELNKMDSTDNYLLDEQRRDKILSTHSTMNS